MAKEYEVAFANNQKSLTAIVTTATALTGANSFLTDTPANTVNLTNGTDTGAGTEGALVTSLAATPRATVTARAIWVWASTDSGTTKRLVASGLMSGHTVAATTEVPWTALAHPDGTIISEIYPLRLQAGEKLYAGTAVTLADGILFVARMSHY